MPKKKKTEAKSEQSARFIDEVKRLIETGELDPEDAEKGIEAVLGNVRPDALQSKANTRD